MLGEPAQRIPEDTGLRVRDEMHPDAKRKACEPEKGFGVSSGRLGNGKGMVQSRNLYCKEARATGK